MSWWPRGRRTRRLAVPILLLVEANLLQRHLTGRGQPFGRTGTLVHLLAKNGEVLARLPPQPWRSGSALLATPGTAVPLPCFLVDAGEEYLGVRSAQLGHRLEPADLVFGTSCPNTTPLRRAHPPLHPEAGGDRSRPPDAFRAPRSPP